MALEEVITWELDNGKKLSNIEYIGIKKPQLEILLTSCKKKSRTSANN